MPTPFEEYHRYAVEHGLMTQEGDSRAANSAHDKLFDAARQLIKNGSGGLILSLFCDPDMWVQLWAATHALEIDEPIAVTKLDELANAGVPLVSMSARYTLQSWRNGELKSPGV
jgi:hypothetical protein